jgi:hypothetical protein
MSKQSYLSSLHLVSIAFVVFLFGCSNYGEKLIFNGGELYYTSAVTINEAQRLGNYLVNSKYYDGNNKTVQLNKENGTYEVRLVIKKGLENDQEVVSLMKTFARDISIEVFGGASVDIHLCDNQLNTLRVVVPLY